MGENGPGCKAAGYISYPRYKQDADNTISPEIIPTSVSWNVIARLYSASQVDEIVPSILADDEPIMAYFLAFLSPGPAVLSLGFQITARDDYVFGERHAEISQASITIRTHSPLPKVKRPRIQDRDITIDFDQLAHIASEIEQLLLSMDLDVLTLGDFGLRPYFAPSSIFRSSTISTSLMGSPRFRRSWSHSYSKHLLSDNSWPLLYNSQSWGASCVYPSKVW